MPTYYLGIDVETSLKPSNSQIQCIAMTTIAVHLGRSICHSSFSLLFIILVTLQQRTCCTLSEIWKRAWTIGHRKEFRSRRQSEWQRVNISLWQRVKARNVSFEKTLRRQIYVINSVENTKLPYFVNGLLQINIDKVILSFTMFHSTMLHNWPRNPCQNQVTSAQVYLHQQGARV